MKEFHLLFQTYSFVVSYKNTKEMSNKTWQQSSEKIQMCRMPFNKPLSQTE
jgi:hypothetical protein